MILTHTADHHWEVSNLLKCQESHAYLTHAIRRIQPDVHVMAGDFWNRRQSLNEASAIIPARQAMIDFANISPVIGVKGNDAHDQPGSYSIFENLDTVYPVYFTERPETVALVKDGGRLSFAVLGDTHASTIADPRFIAIFHLFPYPNKSYFLEGKPAMSLDDANAAISEAIKMIMAGFGVVSAQATCPVILVAHANVTGARLSNGQALVGQDIMIPVSTLEVAGADYVALGHIHKAQEMAKNIRYSGSTYHCNFGEVEPKTFEVVAIVRHGGAVEIRQEPIPSVPLAIHECEYQDRVDVMDKVRDLDGLNAQCDWLNAHLRVRVHLTKEQRGLVDDDEVKAVYGGALTYQIEYITKPVDRVREGNIMKAETLRDKVQILGKTTGIDFPATVLEKADETETQVNAIA